MKRACRSTVPTRGSGVLYRRHRTSPLPLARNPDMSGPVRIHLSRRKGFDLQALSIATNGLPAVKVDRSTGFGNPFPVASAKLMNGTEQWVVGTWNGPSMWIQPTQAEALGLSVKAFRAWLESAAQQPVLARVTKELRGRNLACWCKPGACCHADVLLEIANRPVCEES